MIKTPVLFLGFNRPDLARVVLARLRETGVKNLYVALDGPRSGNINDLALCKSMNDLIDEIDWTEKKHVLKRTENLGCGKAVKEAISWFFQDVDRGIIVEDDCLTDPTFFFFCEEMLERHHANSRVWTITGNSLIPGSLEHSNTHFFSKYLGIWGWATWRRSWEKYDFELASISENEWKNLVLASCENAVESRYWIHILELMLRGEIDTWDFQLQFSAWKDKGLHLTSSRNLVENLGFRGDATHTKVHSPLVDRLVIPNPPPYDEIPVEANVPLDRIVFSEKLSGSKELAEWLFGQNEIQKLSETSNQQNEYIKELEFHMSKRAAIIEALEATRINQEEEIKYLRKELGDYVGLAGIKKWIDNSLKNKT
jgi:hypothetical protein